MAETSISDLSASLAEILNTGGPESLSTTIERYFVSSALSTKKAVSEVLLELLNEGHDEQAKVSRRQSILADSALTYVPLLLPYTTSLPQATDILLLLSEYARPKELILALNEGVQNILDRGEGFTVSDDEDDFEDEDGEDAEVDWVELIAEYELIVRCLTVSIPRLGTSKSTPTLLSVKEAISSSLPLVAHQTSINSARRLLNGMSEMVFHAWKWVQDSSDKGGEQRAILSNLLFLTVTLLGHKVFARLTERWFTRTFPKFQGSPSSDEARVSDGEEGWKEGAESLQRALTTANALNFTPIELLKRIIDPTHLTAHTSLAALNLLACQLPSDPEMLISFLPSPIPTSILDDSMPILCAALSGSSVDAGITWIWAILHASSSENASGNSGEGVIMEFDNASMLVELLVPLTAQHPSALMRLALFKVIGAVINIQTLATDKIQLFKQLLEPANPFDNIRIQTSTLLREQLAVSPQTSSFIEVPTLLEELSPILYSLPSAEKSSEEDPFSLSPAELLSSPYPTWWTEVLSLTWFISSIDRVEFSRCPQRTMIGKWTLAVEKKLMEVQEFLNADNDGGLDNEPFTLMRWEDSLERAKKALGV